MAKFNSTGTALLYSTFLTGSGIDTATGIALDANGDTFVVGTTSSTNFPVTTGALQTTNSASETTGFVTQLNSTGTSLLYSTYLGGSTSTSVNGVAIDASGNAYLTGGTQDTTFPTTAGAYRATAVTKTTAGSSSAFVAKLDPAGTALVYATYLGGSQTDAAFAIAVDSTGEAYVGGNTTSNNFPVTQGAVQGAREASNQQAGFVSKLNASGSALVYSTYLGGEALDNLTSIALDSMGDAYATGNTTSPDFPIISGAFQSKIGISSFNYPQMNAFVTELNGSGTALVYSTFLGGGISFGALADEGDQATGIAVDGQGLVYLTGMACTGDFPVTAGAFEPQNLDGELDGECTAFLTKMNPTPNTPLLYSTFFGGTGNGDASDFFYGEEANGLAIDPSGNVYLAGYTRSVDFPTTAGVVETAFTGPSEEAFVAEFNESEMKTLPVPTVALTSSTSSVLFGQPVTFTATVRPASGNTAPTGYVGFNFLEEEPSDNEGTGVGFGPWTTVALNGSGVATFTTSSLDAPQTRVNAFYLGDTNNAPAKGTMTQTLTDTPTTTTVTPSANNVPYGTSITFTITVVDPNGNPVDQGFVQSGFGNLAGTLLLNSSGQCTWTDSSLPLGTTAVFANFIPYTGYAQSSGTVNVTITPAGTTPTPTFAPPAGNYTSTQQVILNDTNTSGNIYYYYTTNGSILVVGSSNILVTGEPLPVGASETIQAIAVAPGYSASSVASATYTITLPPPSFTLTGTSVSVFPGATSGNTSIISVTPTGGFTGSVVLTASVTSSPTGAQYPPTLSFGSTSPVTLTGSGVQTATLTVSTTAANSAAVVPPKNPGILWNTAAGTVLDRKSVV